MPWDDLQFTCPVIFFMQLKKRKKELTFQIYSTDKNNLCIKNLKK